MGQRMVMKNGCQLTKRESFWDLKCDGTPQSRCVDRFATCRGTTFECKPGFALNGYFDDSFDGSFDAYTVFNAFSLDRRLEAPSRGLKFDLNHPEGIPIVTLYSNGKQVGQLEQPEKCLEQT